MEYKKSPVEKGFDYENTTMKMLQSAGLQAWRTNTANPDDPKQYKAGFDGGVDIIARYSTNEKISKDYVFYIQCKCWKTDITKQAVSEVYAGMHARFGFSKGSIPVVIADSNASEETRQFAKNLNVELILTDELRLLDNARIYSRAPYKENGVLMNVLLYCYTKQKEILYRLPDTFTEIEEPDIKEKLYEETQADFEKIQANLDAIASKEYKLQIERQKNLDMTKMAVMRNIQTVDYYRNKQEKKDKPTITLEDG